MNKTGKIAASAVASLALAGGIGAGIAYADSPSPAPTAGVTATPTQHPGGGEKAARKHRPLLARALHGEVTLAGKKHRVVDVQRGTVAKVSATSVTVRSSDGFTATYDVDATTKVHKQQQPATLADVKPNDRVRVVAVRSGSTLTAQRIGDRGPK